MVDLIQMTENEDGSADFEFEVTDAEKDVFTRIGIRFSIILAAFDLTEEQLVAMLVANAKEGDVLPCHQD